MLHLAILVNPAEVEQLFKEHEPSENALFTNFVSRIDFSLIERLIQAGADPIIKNSNNVSPAELLVSFYILTKKYMSEDMISRFENAIKLMNAKALLKQMQEQAPFKEEEGKPTG